MVIGEAKDGFMTQKFFVVILATFFFAGCTAVPVKHAAVDHHEKLYRRLPYEADGKSRIIEIFYATDRKVKESKGELSFTSALADNLTVGTLKASIRPDLKIGRVVPKKLKKRGAVGVQGVKKMTDSDFIKSLREAVEKSPHKSLFVFVYGFKDNFEMTATKAAYFSYLLDVNTPVLLFDWPGDYWGAIRGYDRAWESATASGALLGDLLMKIVREVKPEKLWLQSSSLGCQVVCNAFERMYQNKDFADAGGEISHVIMAAPDVSRDEFKQKFKDEIVSLTDKLTVYVASNDKALFMARVIDGEKKLGLQKVRLEQDEPFSQVKDLLYLQSLVPEKVSVIDVTPVNRAGGGHTYYIETPMFYDDVYMRLFGAPEYCNRRLYLVNDKEGIDYWIMRDEK